MNTPKESVGIVNPDALSRYQCHKVVRAAKITGIIPPGPPDANGDQISAQLLLEIHGKEQNVKASDAWIAKHNPYAGDYLVIYEDGYYSVSPAKAFEDGYKLIPEAQPNTPPLDPMQTRAQVIQVLAMLVETVRNVQATAPENDTMHALAHIVAALKWMQEGNGPVVTMRAGIGMTDHNAKDEGIGIGDPRKPRAKPPVVTLPNYAVHEMVHELEWRRRRMSEQEAQLRVLDIIDRATRGVQQRGDGCSSDNLPMVKEALAEASR